MQIRCRRIVNGSGEGEALVTSQKINFLTMIDLKQGKIIDKNHELYGNSLTDKILIFPNAVGSSVGAYSIYAMKNNDVAPKAMICNKADIATASGCAIANIPLADQPSSDLFSIRAGARVKLDNNSIIIY